MKKKRKFYLAALIFIFLVSAGAGAVFIRKKNNAKIVNAAFYGLSQDLCQAIREEFLNNPNQKFKVKFDVLAADNFDFAVIAKKYDVFFAWDGEIIQSLSESAEKIPAKILENIPISLRNKNRVPVLLDHFEIALNKEIAQKTQSNPQENFQTFTDFLREANKFAFSPFFTDGSDDKTLLALAGSFAQALGGVGAYKNLIKQMQICEKLGDFLNADLNGDGFSFAEVLDMIKSWPKEEILHPQWTFANKADLKIFAEQNQIAAFFISLSEHRKIPYNIISKFYAVQIPVAKKNLPHCVIAPAVSCVLLSDNSNAKDFLKKLLSVEIQSRLSDKTMLAAVNYRAEEFDSLSDDVRFFAASSENGIMPDLENAAFQRNRDKMKTFAQEIRAYLRQN